MLERVVRILMGETAAPTAWVIERPGCLPMLTHYQAVAQSYSLQPGVYVTPFYSQVRQ